MAWKLKAWHLIAVGVSVVLLLLVLTLLILKKPPYYSGVEIWYTSPTEPNGYAVFHNQTAVIQNHANDGSLLCFGLYETGEWGEIVECTSDQKRMFQGGHRITVTNMRVDPSVANWVSLLGDMNPEYHAVDMNEDPLYPKTWRGWFKIGQGGCLGSLPDPLPVSEVSGISVYNRTLNVQPGCDN
jgi:hypothetical protein